MLLALRSLWEGEPTESFFVSRQGGVAVIYQLGAGWAMEVPGGLMKSQNPDNLVNVARKMACDRK